MILLSILEFIFWGIGEFFFFFFLKWFLFYSFVYVVILNVVCLGVFGCTPNRNWVDIIEENRNDAFQLCRESGVTPKLLNIVVCSGFSVLIMMCGRKCKKTVPGSMVPQALIGTLKFSMIWGTFKFIWSVLLLDDFMIEIGFL